MNTDVKSYNENKSADNPIPVLFDFRDDVAESEQTGKMKAAGSDVFEDSDLATEGLAPYSLQSPESATLPNATPPRTPDEVRPAKSH